VGVEFISIRAAHDELADELEAAAIRVLRGGHYVLANEVEAFEREFASYCESGHAAGVGSGLDALRLALEALGVGAGDEVIVPAHTFIATWLAVTQLGARPVPVEPEEGGFNIDPLRVEAAVTPRTAAVVVVHLYGMPVDWDPIAAIARRHGLALVEDAAQAHGARYQGRRVGSLGDIAAFSFYPSKNLGASGDGGAVVSRSESLIESVRELRNYGSARKYHHDRLGLNSRLDELQAALLRVKLAHLDAWNDRRRGRAEQYTTALDGHPVVTPPAIPAGVESVWHQFVLRCADRELLQQGLARRGVETLIHYPIPPHRSGAYAGEQWPPLPLTERLANEVLSLPIGPHLDDAGAEEVLVALQDAITSSRQ